MRPIALLAACILSCAPLFAGEPAELPPVVYIPTEKVTQVDPSGKGVLLPYERFVKLWEAAQPKPPEDRSDEPPVPAVLAGFAFNGKVSGGRTPAVEGKLTLTATSLVKGWASVALPGEMALSGFACADARVVVERVRGLVHVLAPGENLAAVAKRHLGNEDKQGLIAEANPGLALAKLKPGACLIVPVDNRTALRIHLPTAGTYAITADLAAPVTVDATGRRSLDLNLPAAAAGRLELLLPEPDAAVQLTPAVAATTVAEGTLTRLMTVVGGTDRLRIQWQPPVQTNAAEPMILASTDVLATVGERSLRQDVGIALTVLRAPIRSFQVNLPAETQVLAVEVRGLRTWEREKDVLSVHLHEPAEGALNLVLRLERLLPAVDAGKSQAIALALPSVVQAVRAQGQIALATAPGLALAIDKADGLAQIDPAELKLGNRTLVAAWRFAALPPPLALTATRLVPELRATVQQLVRLGAEEDLITAVIALDVRKAGLFAVRLGIPAGWELTDTSGLVVDDVVWDKYSGARRTTSEPAFANFVLRNRLMGGGELILRLRARATIPRQADAAAGKPVEALIPTIRVEDARQQRGVLAVAAPRSWALTTTRRDGLTGTDAEAVRREGALAAAAKELRDDEELPLAFTWILAGQDAASGAAPVLAFTAAPRARELTLRQEDLLTVAESGVRRTLTWRGEVRYSALAAVRVTAPTSVDESVVFKGPQLAERTAIARKDGTTTWELRFQAPVLGAFTLTAEHQVAVPALGSGAPVQIQVPALGVPEATRLTALTGVAREGNLEVSAAPAAGSQADAVAATDLPPALRLAGTVAGFSAATALPLTLTVTRHELLPLADAAIPLVRYTALVSPDGVVRVLGRALIATRSRPTIELRLPAGAELVEAAVDGTTARPSRRQDGGVVLTLGEAKSAQPHLIAFIYEQRLPGRIEGLSGEVALELPLLGGVAGAGGLRPIPVQHTALEAWLPAGRLITSAKGDLRLESRDESTWSRLMYAVLPQPYRDNACDFADVSRADGLTVRLEPAGVNAVLVRVGEGGRTIIRWVNGGVLDAAGLILALVGLVGAWLLRRRPQALAALTLAAVVAVLISSGGWDPPTRGLLWGVVIGLAMVALAWISGAIAAWRRERRARRDGEALFAHAAAAVPLPATVPAEPPAPPTAPADTDTKSKDGAQP